MGIKEYADAVGVYPQTIRNDITAGRLTYTLRVGAYRPIYDIDAHKHPIASYRKRGRGRPKGVKNKPKIKV